MPDKQRKERKRIEKEKRKEEVKTQAQKAQFDKRKEQREKNMLEGRNTPVNGAEEAELLLTSDNFTTSTTSSTTSRADIGGGPTISSSGPRISTGKNPLIQSVSRPGPSTGNNDV